MRLETVPPWFQDFVDLAEVLIESGHNGVMPLSLEQLQATARHFGRDVIFDPDCLVTGTVDKCIVVRPNKDELKNLPAAMHELVENLLLDDYIPAVRQHPDRRMAHLVALAVKRENEFFYRAWMRIRSNVTEYKLQQRDKWNAPRPGHSYVPDEAEGF